MKRSLFMIAALAAVSGCFPDPRPHTIDGSAYYPAESRGGGGYADVMIGPGLYQIRFIGTGDETGDFQGALWRAAEIANSRRCAWFALYERKTTGGRRHLHIHYIFDTTIVAKLICSNAAAYAEPGGTIIYETAPLMSQLQKAIAAVPR